MAETSEAWRDILLSENKTSCMLFPETVLAFAENRSEEVSSMEISNLFYLFSIIFGVCSLYVSLLDSNPWLLRSTSDHPKLEKKR